MKQAHKAMMQRLTVLLQKSKKRKLVEYNLTLLPWFLLVGFGLVYLVPATWAALLIVVLIVSLMQWLFRQMPDYRIVTLPNLLDHLNRQAPQLEESAQLLLPLDREWTILHRLQKKKVLGELDTLLRQPAGNLLPALNTKRMFWHLGSASFVVMIAWAVSLYPAKDQPVESNTNDTFESVGIASVTITVTPPDYTELEKYQSTDLDLVLTAGSQVEWRIHFSGTESGFYLQTAEGLQHRFEPTSAREFVLSLPVTQSGIYHLGYHSGQLDGLYSMQVRPDRAPEIRVLKPQPTIMEIGVNQQPELLTEVNISDDFGISKVEILGSIAKGSGEAVKFRDQSFSFDTKKVLSSANDKAATYFKEWDLKALGMTPGDELYFTIKAWDNRQPEAQVSRSQTKIVRWLEEEQGGVLSDGILIDFMPEYFKSQRQIIIETIELIESKETMYADEFDLTSRALGIAQSDLKLKYGQYLGDEFDDGGLQPMEDGLAQPDVTIHDSEHGDEGHDELPEHTSEQGHPEHGHEHEQESNEQNLDKSGASELIERFGHSHGDTDIGIFNSTNPKALMKKAIANMWEAELYLMLSKPEQALPFENEALKYLNKARKAERIYVKRLGFEPPPVTEKRRYQGDLSDILSYQQSLDASYVDTDKTALEGVLNTLSVMPADKPLSSQQLMHIERLKTRLIAQAQQQPELIRLVATLERIQLVQRLGLPDCNDCVPELLKALWQRLPAPVPEPVSRQEKYQDKQSSVVQYSRFLKQRQQQTEALSGEEAKP